MVTKKKEAEDAVEAPEVDVVTADVEVEQEDDGKIRKKQIYEQVTVATGLRKREVRESVDATLAYFHQMLSEGHDLQIPPLGKIRCIERGEGENAKMIYKLQLQKPKEDKKDEADAQEGLADGDNAD
ncbi:HU family DNA-binding protein [Amylibacter sp.]|nr:HU family DNA-binding protein [Amylibacter sp.]